MPSKPTLSKGSPGSDRVPRKRRQQSTCDACRLRRVRCDRVDRGDDTCTQCEKKSLTCTFEHNRKRKTRSGKLLEQAKATYGETPPPPPRHIYRAPLVALSTSSFAPPAHRPAPAAIPKAVFAPPEQKVELAPDLIEAYEKLFHPQLPLFSDRTIASIRAGLAKVHGHTSLLGPEDRAIALVMQAWGARFIDRREVTKSKAAVPSTLKNLLIPTTNDTTSDIGEQRDDFALAMLDKALDAVDRAGLMRTVSRQNVTTLLVLESLLSWNDTRRQAGRTVLSAACEQIRILYDLPSERLSTDSDPSFWTAWLRDSVSAALGGRLPHLSEEDLAAICPKIVALRPDKLEEYVKVERRAELEDGPAVAALFRHLAHLAGNVARMNGPLARRHPLDFNAVHILWHDLRRSAAATATFTEAVRRFSQHVDSSAPVLRDLVTYRAQIAFALHRHIEQRLELHTATLEADEEHGEAYFTALTELKTRSDGVFLRAIEDIIDHARTHDTHLVFSALFCAEHLPLQLDHLVTTLCDTEGGDLPGWTLQKKYDAVSWLLSAVRQVGWCFPITPSLSTAQSCLAHLRKLSSYLRATPSHSFLPPATLSWYSPEPSEPPVASTSGARASGMTDFAPESPEEEKPFASCSADGSLRRSSQASTSTASAFCPGDAERARSMSIASYADGMDYEEISEEEG
ncbi:hypothetical protein JCM8547_004868 [Rhodosporidiobolus lusitaniae]